MVLPWETPQSRLVIAIWREKNRSTEEKYVSSKVTLDVSVSYYSQWRYGYVAADRDMSQVLEYVHVGRGGGGRYVFSSG